MKSNRIKLLTISLLLFVSSAIADPEIVKFTVVGGLQDPFGGSMYWIGDNGNIFGGTNYFGGGFRWTHEEGLETIVGPYIRDMDAQGTFIGNNYFPILLGDTLAQVNAPCYYDGEDWVMIGPILGTLPDDNLEFYQSAWAVAADTLIISGMYWHGAAHTTAFVWSPDHHEGELLPDNGVTMSSRPNDMSADGSVIAGFAATDISGQITGRAAHAWFRNETSGNYEMQYLGALHSDGIWLGGEAFGVSPNGELICGWSPSAMFIWTAETGMQEIGYAPGHNPSTAGVVPMDINDNGTAIGFAQAETWVWAREAIIYTPESGIIFLKDSLENLGLEDQFEDWGFLQANGISNDGRIIVGSALGVAGILQPFILEFIPPTAPTDLVSEIYNDPLRTYIELNWVDDPNNNEFNYHLQRRVTIADSTSEWTTLAHPDSSHSSYVDAEIYIANGVEWEYRLRAENPVGESEWVEIMTASDVDEISSGLPIEFSITSAYPNPFNSSTNIQYEIPERMNTQIVMYSVTGAELVVLSDGMIEAGNHSFQLDMSGYSSGVYLVRIISGDKMDVQKLTLIK